MNAILHYLAHVITDGDYLNDWLTHMPADTAQLMQTIGQALALYLQ